jgi:hypothetical protein
VQTEITVIQTTIRHARLGQEILILHQLIMEIITVIETVALLPLVVVEIMDIQQEVHQVVAMVIIILAQDVIMDIVVVVEVLALVQALIQVVVRDHLLNQLRRGAITVIQVHLQLIRHQVQVLAHLLMEVRQVAVHRLVEVRQEVVVLAVEVEAEVHDKINKTLTSKIPSKRTFEGIFSFKV